MFKKKFFVALLVVALSLTVAVPVFAQDDDLPAEPEVEVVPDDTVEDEPDVVEEPSGVDELIAFLDMLLGFIPEVGIAAPLIAFIVDALKKYARLPDGRGGLAALLLNALFFGAIYVASRLGAGEEFGVMIIELGKFAPAVMAVLVAVWGSDKVHKFAAKRRFGYSYSEPGGLHG